MEDWSNGPDKLIESDSLSATKLTDAVKIREVSDEPVVNALTPTSVYTAFYESVKLGPNNIALVSCKQDKNLSYTYDEYWSLCNKASKSFIKLGLKVNTCAAIIGFNSPEWMFSLYGTIFAGGVACGIYTTNSAEACEFIFNDSGSEIVLVENKDQLDKILKCKDKCNLRSIIQLKGEVDNDHNGLVMNWNQFLECGSTISDDQLQKRVKTIAPNKCATLIYTSGTTGNPKAVMLSHDNIYVTAKHMIRTGSLRPFNEKVVSYLPLSHIAAQLFDCYIVPFIGGTLYFAEPDALKGSLAQTLLEVRPTIFFGVPRVWEKMHDKIETIINAQSKLKKSVLNWASKIGHEYVTKGFENRPKNNFSFFFANKVVLNNVKAQLGFDNCRLTFSGAAPINIKTLEFFHSLGFPICEIFGMSESTAPHIIGMPDQNRVTSVGNQKNEFNKSKLGENDELCLFGRNVFMGYLNSPEKTKEAIDEQGWLHTGDIARIEKDGFVFITGRIKELLITAGGENIAPIPIEDALKDELKLLVSNCMLIGDQKKFLSMLVTLKSKVNMDTLEPLDELSDDIIKWLREKGSKASTVTDVITQKEILIYDEIEAGIKRANAKSISRAAVVQKFTILPKDFSIVTGELGPTLKLRRQIVTKKYEDTIDTMYQTESQEKKFYSL